MKISGIHNYFVNPGFEGDFSFASAFWSSTNSMVTTEKYSGNRSLKVNIPVQSRKVAGIILWSGVANNDVFKVGETVYGSLMIKAPAGLNFVMCLRYNVDGVNRDYVSSIPFTATGGWQNVSGSLTAAVGGVGKTINRLSLCVIYTPGSDITAPIEFYLDEVMLSRYEVPYFDGSMPNARWVGVADKSYSALNTPTTVAPMVCGITNYINNPNFDSDKATFDYFSSSTPPGVTRTYGNGKLIATCPATDKTHRYGIRNATIDKVFIPKGSVITQSVNIEELSGGSVTVYFEARRKTNVVKYASTSQSKIGLLTNTWVADEDINRISSYVWHSPPINTPGRFVVSKQLLTALDPSDAPVQSFSGDDPGCVWIPYGRYQLPVMLKNRRARVLVKK